MRSFLKISKLTLLLLGLLLLTLVAVIVPRVIAFQDSFIPRSTVTISIEASTLKFQFQIIEADQQKVSEISKKLALEDNWTEGISITLDSTSTAYLQPYLPLTTKTQFESNAIRLSGSSFALWNKARLSSAIAGHQWEYATNGGRLNIVQKGSEEVLITVNNPKVLVNPATVSGKLSITSERLSRLMPILEKLDTIKLRVWGKRLDGEILLK